MCEWWSEQWMKIVIIICNNHAYISRVWFYTSLHYDEKTVNKHIKIFPYAYIKVPRSGVGCNSTCCRQHEPRTLPNLAELHRVLRITRRRERRVWANELHECLTWRYLDSWGRKEATFYQNNRHTRGQKLERLMLNIRSGIPQMRLRKEIILF